MYLFVCIRDKTSLKKISQTVNSDYMCEIVLYIFVTKCLNPWAPESKILMKTIKRETRL